MKKNRNLNTAKAAKNDEFYTRLTDIEKEMRHYWPQFEGKTILCNCDDPETSNFWWYFHMQFSHLHIKRLMATHFVYEDFFSPGETYLLDYTGGNDGDCTVGHKTILQGNGDFRSAECISFLKEADIVITNPPFSLFREYVAQLFEYEKKFIIIGNINVICYKEIFPLMMNNKMWLGPSISSGGRDFEVPEKYARSARFTGTIKDGHYFQCVAGIRWFTNLDVKNRHDKIFLVQEYSPEAYPTYDNYDAINVNHTKDIPKDYDGVMGVPVSFFDKYNPEQFEVLGLDRYVEGNTKPNHRFMIKGKELYARVAIRRRV